jgi:hypothetical protein
MVEVVQDIEGVCAQSERFIHTEVQGGHGPEVEHVHQLRPDVSGRASQALQGGALMVRLSVDADEYPGVVQIGVSIHVRDGDHADAGILQLALQDLADLGAQQTVNARHAL